MKKLFLITVLCFVCFACSKNDNTDSTKGKIEKFTEQVGKEAAEGIKKPIDKARKIEDLAEKRIKKLENPEDQQDE